MNTGQPRNILDSYMKILNSLECPVCFDYLQTPIHQCLAGHVLCHTCFSTTANICPTCRGIINASSRARSLEYISEVILVPCRNDGCSEVLAIKDVKMHEDRCSFPKFTLEYEKQRASENNLVLHLEDCIAPFFVTKPSVTNVSQETQTENSSEECALDAVDLILNNTFSKERPPYMQRNGLKIEMAVDTDETTDDLAKTKSQKYALIKSKNYPKHSNKESENVGEETDNSDNEIEPLALNIWNKPKLKIDWSYN